ncbi:SWIM zinc finger family protein [Micromonospora sp. WMMD882]|uniref:SWIM zinc finger family protein n=1 Tax=Micromonospora sp. WMMD882 TaxID=3015151 RepID=UPI00248C4555|nr:SWIM zinc finger family protein [Micromonospora sp. WMMD882]WBB80723.1 SWIM zinc finger family protein [Micromonospora sp. WMMD882]
MPVDRWSTAQVLALAPDASAGKGARSVSGAAKWSASGLTGEVLWGLCKGSGKNPYQVCVDLAGPAYRCSCPSRKFPCKHALGLLLLWAETGAGEAEAPPWVTEWQAGRAARAARVATPRSAAGPADAAAAAKRVQQRATRVAAGLDELRRWLDDQAEQGLAVTEQAGRGPFDAMAARLVDAQAPAVAGTVRRLGRDVGVGPHWADRLLGELALIRLLVTAHDRLDALPADLAATVRSRVGYPTTTEEVLATPPLRDHWQVLGQVDSGDDKVTTRRSWLRGARSGRFALVLAFAAPGQAFPADVVPGTEIDADLCFYPGALPLRALVATRHGAPTPLTAPAGAVDVRAALAGYAAALAAEPWRETTPVVLAGVTPSRGGHLVDRAGDALPLLPGHDEPWWLLAGAGGRPVDVAAELGPNGLRPLAAWSDGHYLPAAAGVPVGARGRHRPELPTDLLSAALVGTARRPWSGPVSVAGRPVETGGDGPGGLLEGAAVAVAYRRAGTRPASGRTPVPAAPAESTPVLSSAPTARLRLLLAEGGAPGGAQTQQELLAEWLGLADRHGALAPVDTLPALLDEGRRDRSLRPLVSRLGGRRGRWLAGLRSDWGYLWDEAPAEDAPADGRAPATAEPLTTLPPTAPDGGTGSGGAGGDEWETGTAGERVAYLTRLRGRAPDAARELLTAAFAGENATDRARFVAALEVGLSPADEPFLERALDDRRREVRDAALTLLRQLPDSALRRRTTQRALGCVRPSPDGRGLVVEAPKECDRAMRRDGVDPQPPRGVGVGAWLLIETLAHTPLSTWTTLLGRDPAQVVALPVVDDWAPVLRQGWARAAAEQRDPAWAQALVDAAGTGRAGDRQLPGQALWPLYAIMPAGRLAKMITHALRGDPHRANQLLRLHPGDWSDELTGAVVDAIENRARDKGNHWHLTELCRLCAVPAAPGAAGRVRQLADELEQTDAEPTAVRAVAQLAAVLTFRSEMHKEFR